MCSKEPPCFPLLSAAQGRSPLDNHSGYQTFNLDFTTSLNPSSLEDAFFDRFSYTVEGVISDRCISSGVIIIRAEDSALDSETRVPVESTAANKLVKCIISRIIHNILVISSIDYSAIRKVVVFVNDSVLKSAFGISIGALNDALVNSLSPSSVVVTCAELSSSKPCISISYLAIDLLQIKTEMWIRGD